MTLDDLLEFEFGKGVSDEYDDYTLASAIRSLAQEIKRLKEFVHEHIHDAGSHRMLIGNVDYNSPYDAGASRRIRRRGQDR